MKHTQPRAGRSAKTGHFVLDSARGEQISAVEGLKLSGRMQRILRDSASGKFTGEEARAMIKAEVRKRIPEK